MLVRNAVSCRSSKGVEKGVLPNPIEAQEDPGAENYDGMYIYGIAASSKRHQLEVNVAGRLPARAKPMSASSRR